MSSASMHAPAIGLGTWRMGESARHRAAEIAAVRQAIELGYRLFDTAEMYGEGGAESMLGRALQEAMAAGDVKRSELTVVSKVYPHNASRKGTVAACERSLKRLSLQTIDVYLLHWPGSHPLQETVDAFEELKADKRIAAWGVSNFDVAQMQALWAVQGGPQCSTNQVWYSLSRRGADFDLRPWLRDKGLPLMAYSPIDQAALADHAALARIGQRLGATGAQLALAWTLRDGDVVAIPKSARLAHLRDNLAAAQIKLDADALKAIDAAFPPPKQRQPLAIN
jgi:diketogulonate reductase-like aldo/keto reductase